MKNLTVSVDDSTLERARAAAQKRGRSLNALIREFLDELAGARQRRHAAAELRKLWAEGTGDSGGKKITRDDAYEGRL